MIRRSRIAGRDRLTGPSRAGAEELHRRPRLRVPRTARVPRLEALVRGGPPRPTVRTTRRAKRTCRGHGYAVLLDQHLPDPRALPSRCLSSVRKETRDQPQTPGREPHPVRSRLTRRGKSPGRVMLVVWLIG